MVLATSGPLSLNNIHVEAGGSTGTTCSFQDTDIRGLTPASGRSINATLGSTIDISDFYGASAVSATTVIDQLNLNTYRSYIETANKGDTQKRNYLGVGGAVDADGNETDTSFCHGSNSYRFETSVVVDLAWGAIPSGWEDINGATIIFWHYALNASASTNGFHTDSGGTTRTLSLTDYNMPLTYGEVHAGYFSSSSSVYNLNNSTLGATFNKTSSNTHNGQRIFGIPGQWNYVTNGVATSGSSTTVGCQPDDLVIVFSAANGDSCTFHTYQDTTNLTKLGATAMGRWYSHSNTSLYKTTSTSFSLRGSVSGATANVAYFVIRFSG